jgi:hypothetical protein
VEYVRFTPSKPDRAPQGLNTVVKTLGINRSKPLVFVYITGSFFNSTFSYFYNSRSNKR